MPGSKPSAFRPGSPNWRNLELYVRERLSSRGKVDRVTIAGSEEGVRDVRRVVLPRPSGGDSLLEQPRIVEGDLAQVVVAAGGAAVAGVEVDLEEGGGGAVVERAHLGHVLGGLPVHHLAVVQ